MEPALPVPPIEELDAMFAELVVGGPFHTYSALFLFFYDVYNQLGKSEMSLSACLF